MIETAEIPYGIAIVILLLALIWGAWHFRFRSRRAEALHQEATRELYEEPERYDEERRAELQAETEKAEAEAEERGEDKKY